MTCMIFDDSPTTT
ncbi:hypothetical protein JL09_g7031 [Pichia kudriavzevii]|uniref:Uncharacterized protein n=1 Tax=Pichia kudriavzevii TaxID=4909 RepID=A0A099NKB2_PICKU|nr:hypothetical protein JL09_g7031 [Pichia kudriavzevii]